MIETRRVFADGKHNAFTSLTRWRGSLYLAFRSATSHASPKNPDGDVMVMVSDDDGLTWASRAILSGGPGIDMRDPKLVATPDRLYVHSFAYLGADRRDACVSWTADGTQFTPFSRTVTEDNVVIWWPVWHNGRFYGTGYRYTGDKLGIRSVFLTSPNGLHWDIVSVVYDVPWANESALVMEPDGSATVLVRNDGHRLRLPSSDGRPVLARAKPPFVDWQYEPLPRIVQGFALHKLDHGYLIAGRVFDPEGTRTAIMTYDAGQLRRHATLPSGGDTAYPGIVRAGNRVWMSYYSSHESPGPAGGVGGGSASYMPASIYLATFDLAEVMAQGQGVEAN